MTKQFDASPEGAVRDTLLGAAARSRLSVPSGEVYREIPWSTRGSGRDRGVATG
jgi:hypothetical protein